MSWHTEDPFLWGQMLSTDWEELVAKAKTLEDVAHALRCPPEEVNNTVDKMLEECDALKGKVEMLRAGLDEFKEEHDV